MPISSNTLFHFTNSKENLLNILRNNFNPKYVLEDLGLLLNSSHDDNFHVGVPMVCFCDLPLSEVGKHIEVYGNYGIGLTKAWGMQNGIAPILYTHDESIIANKLRKIFAAIPRSKYRLITELLCFIKPLRGDFLRKEDYIRNYNYCDEKEWRYIPKDNNAIVPKKNMLQPVLKNKANNLIEGKFTLYFEPKNIRYLIVKDEGDILPLIHDIELAKVRFDPDQVRLLTTRIISVENIKEDF